MRSDYNSLQTQYSRIDVARLEANNDTATGITAPRCSSDLISADDFSDEFDIPSRPSGVDALISSGISNPPTGGLVVVTATAVALPVYDVGGASVSNLAITVTSQANRPVGTASRTSSRTSSRSGSATGSSSATGASASASQTGAANRLSGAAALALGAAVLAL